MTTRVSILAGLAAFALVACGQNDEPGTDAGTAQGETAAGLTDSQMRQAKTQCGIAAVAQGGTAEQAKTLCDCTIERIAEGKTPEDFAAVSEQEANSVLEQCATENGMADDI